MPLRRHDRRLRPLPPGPSPRLRRGTATSPARSALVVPPDLGGFLRRAPVRRPRPRRPAGLLRPAAGHGVRQVSVLPYSSWLPADVVGPRFEAFPTGEDPSKLFPPRQPPPSSPQDLLLAKEAAFTEGAFPLAVGSRRPFRVTTARASRPRPQGLHPPRSPLPEQDVSALSGPMLPWALDRIVRMPAARLLRGAHADSLFGGSFRPDGTSRRGVRRHPRVARSASFSACLAPRGPMLELTRRSAARRFRLAGSPKTATLPVPPDAPPEGNQDRSQARSSRRSTHAAPGMTRRPSGRRERSRGNPP
jgi:hypothetical protein